MSPRGGLQAVGSFPSRARIPLRYVAYYRINPGVLTGTDTIFSLNSIFDPDVSGAGHQPREFDTWATLYAKYRVHSCTATLMARQRAAHGLNVWMIPSNSSATFATANIPSELPRAVKVGMTGSSQPIVEKTEKFDCHAILGVTKAQYVANEGTAALVTADPAEAVYLHIWAQQPDATTVLDFEFELVLTYDCEFFDRVYTSPSALVAHATSIARGADGVVVPNPAPAPPPPPRSQLPPVPQVGLLRYVTGL